MVEGYALPKIAKHLNIHISTAFYWKHKILYSLGSLGFNQLQGIVESDEQDSNGNLIARKAGTGRVKAEEIDMVIGEYVNPSALLCTDNATNYKKFAKTKGLKHETINERQKERVKKGIFHIQHVNNAHSRFKKWVSRFQGVATHYFDNTSTGFDGWI